MVKNLHLLKRVFARHLNGIYLYQCAPLRERCAMLIIIYTKNEVLKANSAAIQIIASDLVKNIALLSLNRELFCSYTNERGIAILLKKKHDRIRKFRSSSK